MFQIYEQASVTVDLLKKLSPPQRMPSTSKFLIIYSFMLWSRIDNKSMQIHHVILLGLVLDIHLSLI